MKAFLFAVASIFVVTAFATEGEARPYYQAWTGSNYSLSHHYRASRSAYQGGSRYGAHHARSGYGTSHHRQHSSRSYRTHTARSGVAGRPARWCGWWMRTQKGGGPELNLAANWRHWGHPTGPRVGAVVVWSHHVGMITGRTAGGEWIVKSGNDGGAVRERPRSVAGAVFRI
ncbi:hypothetical protein [Methyloceanibacter sp.]|uniref:hypothetical protein n=1 Tax=Methyloceanibacter sp. TaxID=1965321 RepID=UPI003D6C88F6